MMETSVQASNGWMLRRQVLTHCGPEAAPEAARWRWSLPWLGSVQTLAVPADSGRTVEIFLQAHIVNLGGKRERERWRPRGREIFVKTWPEMRRKRSPCWVGLCKPRNTESEPGRASSPWPRWRDQQADLWERALGSEDLGAWRPKLCQSWPWSYRQWRKGGKPQIPGVSLLGR